MRARPALLGLALLAVLAAACSGGNKSRSSTPSMRSAAPFADDFVRRLVVVGRWRAIADDVSPLVQPDLRRFQETIRRNGVRRVVGHGQLRGNCPASAILGAGKECFIFHLVGRQVVPVAGVRRVKARYRVWLKYEDGRWVVINYDYDAKVTPGF